MPEQSSQLLKDSFVNEKYNPATDLYEAEFILPKGKLFKPTVQDLCKYYNENYVVEEVLKDLANSGITEKTGGKVMFSMNYYKALNITKNKSSRVR